MDIHIRDDDDLDDEDDDSDEEDDDSDEEDNDMDEEEFMDHYDDTVDFELIDSVVMNDDEEDDDDDGEYVNDDDSEAHDLDFNDYPNAKDMERLKNNDPKMKHRRLYGDFRLNDIQKFGECLYGNTNIINLEFCFRITDGQEANNGTDASFDAAFQGIYDFLETSPALKTFHLDLRDSNKFDFVKNLLHRIYLRTQKNPPLPGLRRVVLKQCLFHPTQLVPLLRSTDLKQLVLTFRTPDVPYSNPTDWQEARQALAENSTLEFLSISGYFAALLPESMPKSCMLQKLTLRGAFDENNPSVGNIVPFLQQCPNLSEMIFWRTMGKAFNMIAPGLASGRSAVSELVTICSLDQQGRDALVKLLQSTQTLRELQVCGPNSTWLAALQGLMANRSVEYTMFYRNDDPNEDDCEVQRPISRLLQMKHPTLCFLNFHSLTNADATVMFQALASNTSVTSLDLTLEDTMNRSTAWAMLHCFTVNKTLTKFELRCNYKRMAVVRILFDALKATQAKSILYLTEDDDAAPFPPPRCTLCSLTADLIGNCKSLVKLNVFRERTICACTAVCVKSNFRAMEKTRSLEDLGFGWLQTHDNAIFKLQAEQLIQTLPKLVSLQSLSMAFPKPILLERHDELLKAVSRNCSLDEFHCNSTVFENECKIYLTRNKERREFLVSVGSSSMDADDNGNEAPPTPPGLLAHVLATTRTQPYGAGVIYEVLRRNVHAVGFSSS